jgi:hypothetical protein
MRCVDKPQPIFAGLVWAAFLVAVMTLGFDEHDVLATLGDAVAYALLGAAFGLSAYFLGRVLIGRTPTERQVARGKSLRRFRLQATALHLVILLALGFAGWRIGGGADRGYGSDAPLMSVITFMMIQTALGWPWSKLGMKPVPDRPDAARV